MVFRLPSHLESLVPPPASQHPQAGPWRGSIIATGMRALDRSGNQEIRVTAVETDGEKMQHWPAQFFASITIGPIYPSLCTFMPDRIRDSNENAVNATQFRSLSRILFEGQMVAVAAWGTNIFPGGGIIIYPAQNSSALLVGALFFDTPFPDFVLGHSTPPNIPMSPGMMQQARHPYYQQTMVPQASYGSPSHHAHSRSPHRSNPNSPIEHPVPGHRQEQYRYIMPRGPYANPGQSSADPSAWTPEDEAHYSTFSPTHQNPPYP
ncbi:hypothetical protein BDQ17DRAFT_1388208 [Cyathus striatus]|nr:hypothetical protein BDQ17DRAFT_1388208 [Cyathus striatus]